jgi:hypothetical protein
MLGIAGASEKGAGLQRIRLALVQKWYGAWRRVLKRTYYVACRIRGSNPSSAQRRSGGTVGQFVGALGVRISEADGTVYQGRAGGIGRSIVYRLDHLVRGIVEWARPFP